MKITPASGHLGAVVDVVDDSSHTEGGAERPGDRVDVRVTEVQGELHLLLVGHRALVGEGEHEVLIDR